MSEPAVAAGRAGLIEEIDRGIAQATGAGCIAVAHLHLRRLRQLLVLMGYQAVDHLMLAAEARLRGLLRKCDLLLRIGEADLIVVLRGLRSSAHARLAAERILQQFEAPLPVLGRQLTPLLALGLAIHPDHGADGEALCLRAAAALDEALRNGRRCQLASGSEDRLLLHDDLRDALAENRLSLAFQPVVSTRDGRWHAVESLARWHCPRHGHVRPSRFVPLAEQTGLVGELTRWSIHASLREFAPLHRRLPALRCAVNLSPRAFAEAALVEQIHAALAIWDLPPEALLLEVTETAMMEDPEHSAESLKRLHRSGIQIAIDDFGRGFSSFTYLQRFPVQELKIDQSFVLSMVREQHSAQLVRAMIAVAHHLGMLAVAEGIEDEATLALVRDMGCDLAQGFLIGRPMRMGQLLERVEERGLA